MKEMYLKLPMVEIGDDPQDACKAIHYRKSGCYIIRRSNGDVTVANVQVREVGIDEVRAIDEETINIYEMLVKQPDLLDPNSIMLPSDYEDAMTACKEDRERYEARLADMNAQIEHLKEDFEGAMAEKEKECKALIYDKEAELHAQYATLNEANEQKLAMRRMELEHEFEKKVLQLDLEKPKRFGQGEWISGKTLTEIIKTLADKKEG